MLLTENDEKGMPVTIHDLSTDRGKLDVLNLLLGSFSPLSEVVEPVSKHNSISRLEESIFWFSKHLREKEELEGYKPPSNRVTLPMSEMQGFLPQLKDALFNYGIPTNLGTYSFVVAVHNSLIHQGPVSFFQVPSLDLSAAKLPYTNQNGYKVDFKSFRTVDELNGYNVISFIVPSEIPLSEIQQLEERTPALMPTFIIKDPTPL